MPEKKKLSAAKKKARLARRRKRIIKRTVWRCVLVFLTLIAVLVVAILAGCFVAFRGPSQSIADQLTMSLMETSALKFVPRIYYSEDEVNAIIERNSVEDNEEETDTSMIVIATPEPAVTPTPDPKASSKQSGFVPTPSPEPSHGTPVVNEDGIEIYEIHGATYNGYMMVVKDPSRVSVGTPRDYYNGQPGLQLNAIAKRYDAVAAINGGGFKDDMGSGNGGKPTGLVVSNGKLLHGVDNGSIHNVVVGFDVDNKLIMGKKMTLDQAKKKKLRDALAFGPILVQNGEAAYIKGASSGLNPRTGIGQRADGAVLMLVIDGRQANSLGASYADMIQHFMDFGAVNACNLDGGSSSLLYYKGEYMNNGVVITGSRKLPSAFIVK